MSTTTTPKSIRDLLPLDQGGIEARNGFALQDHIAAGFCIDMLTNSTIKEIWCENQDDITIIWDTGQGELVEFVQVKGSGLNQLWTVAKLCEPQAKTHGAGLCILEKSLAQDRCTERVRFRLVTTRDVDNDLRILTLPIGAPGRSDSKGSAKFKTLHTSLKSRVSQYKSSNGNDCVYWAQNVYWDVRHTEDAVKNENILKLNKTLQSRSTFLAIDQINELYIKLLKKVWDAALARPDVAPHEKRIHERIFKAWLAREVMAISAPSGGAAARVQQKMAAANLSHDTVLAALSQRQFYRSELLRPKYMKLDDLRLVEAEVLALMQRLKSQLDNGVLDDNGIAFHNHCLAELEGLRVNLPIERSPTSAFLQGCMYDITGRCLHRFRRISA